MERRNFVKLSAGACLVGTVPTRSFMRNKRVLLITGQVKDTPAIMPIPEDKIESEYNEILFEELKKGDIFLLQSNIQYTKEPTNFDGPFKAIDEVFITEGLNDKQTHGIHVEPYKNRGLKNDCFLY